jgi:uncharacterized protein (DUF362 family)
MPSDPDDLAATDRRGFLLHLLRAGGLGAASVGLGSWLHARSSRPIEGKALTLDRTFVVAPDPTLPELVVAQGDSPRALVRQAFHALGGAGRFIARGDVVVVKPNIGWDRVPEQAATTNPEVVAEIVRLCTEAGAKKVIVTDVSCHDARPSFQRSGIARAAVAEGAEVLLPEPRRFREVDLRGESLQVWPVLQPFLECDKVINVPIAKHHSLTGVTLGLKNWYGILGGQRNRLHQRIDESLADLCAFMKPTLTVLDAYRVLMRNGPTGGSLADVELRKTLVAGTDPVAIDAYAAKGFWDIDFPRLRFLRMAKERGLGNPVFEELRTKVIAG